MAPVVGQLAQINFTGFNSGAYPLGFAIVPVPEPIEWALIIFAAAGIFFRFGLPRRRRATAKA